MSELFNKTITTWIYRLYLSFHIYMWKGAKSSTWGMDPVQHMRRMHLRISHSVLRWVITYLRMTLSAEGCQHDSRASYSSWYKQQWRWGCELLWSTKWKWHWHECCSVEGVAVLNDVTAYLGCQCWSILHLYLLSSSSSNIEQKHGNEEVCFDSKFVTNKLNYFFCKITK